MKKLVDDLKATVAKIVKGGGETAVKRHTEKVSNFYILLGRKFDDEVKSQIKCIICFLFIKRANYWLEIELMLCWTVIHHF